MKNEKEINSTVYMSSDRAHSIVFLRLLFGGQTLHTGKALQTLESFICCSLPLLLLGMLLNDSSCLVAAKIFLPTF